MIAGIDHETIALLRERFPRLQLPELISRIAAFPNQCWAGTAYLAEQIGRSQRTIFRYYRKLREQGVLRRVWGSRELEQMPAGAEHPEKLRSHGYKLTGFTGWLEPIVSQGIERRRRGMTEAERRQAQRERKRQEHRERRRKAERERRERERTRLEVEFPALAAAASKPADSRRVRSAPRPAPPIGPRYSVPAPADVGAPLPERRDTGPPE